MISDKDKNCSFFPVDLKLGDVQSGSLACYGISAHSFLYNSATIGMEFIHNYLLRIYKMYAGIGRYTKHTTREDFYLGMINTSTFNGMLDEFGDWTLGVSEHEALLQYL